MMHHRIQKILQPVLLLIFITLGLIQSCRSLSQESVGPLFERLQSDHTGITFTNDIQENLSTKENLFDFDFFYNGAGVGVADFNNDGLQDIVFCGNQMSNELYVNRGDLRFEKIIDAFADTYKKHWSNGVSIADVDNDGWLDIYVSQGGPHDPDMRTNLLYINNGDLTFTESASLYGLDDKSISTQSAFFDYDKDGDLDCIVMNENAFYGLDPISFYQAIGEDEDVFWANCSHFYRNDNKHFIDITKDAGLLKPSFGLGLAVSDLNSDGWLDVYIANDYYIPDAMYINQGDGTFEDEIKTRTDQLSFYGMGVDVADVNNDGLQDIFVLDMASSDHYRSKTLMRSMNVGNFRMLVNTLQFPHQYMFNTLQINDGNNKYMNVAHIGGVAKTDWSWSVLMNDYDLDGHKDILVTNGYRRYALDNDFQNAVLAAKKKYSGQVPLEVKKELYDMMPSEVLSNIMYKNMGELQFEERTKDWGFDFEAYSIGAATADFDNDGDLDIVVNNMDGEASIFKNLTVENGLNNYLTVIPEDDQGVSEFSKVNVVVNGNMQSIECRRTRGYMSSSQPIAVFGIGDAQNVELLEIEWSDGTKTSKQNINANEIITVKKEGDKRPKNKEKINSIYHSSEGQFGLVYNHVENRFDDFKKEILLPYMQSTLGPGIVTEDYDGDGLEDILILSAAGQQNILFRQTQRGFETIDIPLFTEDKYFEDLDAVFFDLNGDGHKDLYIVTGGNEYEKEDEFYADRIYLGDGKEGFLRGEIPESVSTLYSGKVVQAFDYDRDGDEDLILGNRIIPQMFPYAAPSFIFENQDGVLKDVTAGIAPELSSFGIINDIEITDFNGDGWDDIVAVGEWSGIGLFRNNKGSFSNVASEYGLDDYRGWWYSVTPFNANDDDRPDFIIGNMGLNSKYSGTRNKPLKVFASDFDDNGTWDLVLSKKYKNDYVPFRGRECSSQQMPFILEDFPTYDLFANATLEDIYGQKLKESYEAYSNIFHSVALMSADDGYEMKLLPNEAQLFPILDGISINNDNGSDAVILVGNIYNTEVETPRLDMGRGITLSFDTNGWKVQRSDRSGLLLDGNIKSVAKVNHKGQNQTIILGGVNNGKLKVYTKE